MTDEDKRRREARVDEVLVYDDEEIIPNCTVHILRNTYTGDYSIGFYRHGEEPPYILEMLKEMEEETDSGE